MDFRFLIGHEVFSYARARTRIYRSVIALSFCLVLSSILSFAQDTQFILGQDSRIHSVAVDHVIVLEGLVNGAEPKTLYAYSLPQITIPSKGVLRLYAGTDDHLYYDAALTHPFHSGFCGSTRS